MTATSAPPGTLPQTQHQPVDTSTLFRRLYKSYAFKTIASGILTILAVTTFTFVLIRLMPGDPVSIKVEQLLRQQNITLEEATQRAMTMLNYNPDTPLLEQYASYMVNLLRGDLGESITSSGTKVTAQILRFLPWTLFSVGLGLSISFSLGTLTGVAMAYWRGGMLDNVMTAFASIMYGIPDYVLALLLIIVAGVQLKIIPYAQMLGGSTPGIQPGFTPEYIGDILFHAVLPVSTYVLTSIGGWMLTMKSSTLATLGEDYITVARARGLSERRLLFAYVGRNALLPLMTRLAISVGFVVGGSVVIETLFQYPGVGKALAEATGKRDYTTIQGFFLVIAVSVIVSNILADLLFGLLDPRVRPGREDNP